MSPTIISATLRQRVATAFEFRCAYCQTSQRIIGPLLEIDHIVPTAHAGGSEEANLCLAYPLCNSYKGAQVEAIDPETGVLTRLFHPRQDRWEAHFEWEDGGAKVRGTTASGRATVAALQMNHPGIVATRELWITVGWHPPARGGDSPL